MKERENNCLTSWWEIKFTTRQAQMLAGTGAEGTPTLTATNSWILTVGNIRKSRVRALYSEGEPTTVSVFRPPACYKGALVRIHVSGTELETSARTFLRAGMRPQLLKQCGMTSVVIQFYSTWNKGDEKGTNSDQSHRSPLCSFQNLTCLFPRLDELVMIEKKKKASQDWLFVVSTRWVYC
jgi:hypothetical protein